MTLILRSAYRISLLHMSLLPCKAGVVEKRLDERPESVSDCMSMAMGVLGGGDERPVMECETQSTAAHKYFFLLYTLVSKN